MLAPRLVEPLGAERGGMVQPPRSEVVDHLDRSDRGSRDAMPAAMAVKLSTARQAGADGTGARRGRRLGDGAGGVAVHRPRRAASRLISGRWCMARAISSERSWAGRLRVTRRSPEFTWARRQASSSPSNCEGIGRTCATGDERACGAAIVVGGNRTGYARQSAGSLHDAHLDKTTKVTVPATIRSRDSAD